MFSVLLLCPDPAGGALVQPGVLRGLHRPLQGLLLVNHRQLDGSKKPWVVLYTLEAVIFKTEIQYLKSIQNRGPLINPRAPSNFFVCSKTAAVIV